MADSAQSLPLPRSLLAHIADPTIQQELLPRYEALVGRARALKPEPGSVGERELVGELAMLLFDMLERLGPHALGYLRSDVQGQLDELECTVGDLDDLTYWSRRAIEGSRKVDALLPRLASEVRAVSLQLRARWAWEDWDEEDIEDEIRAWKELSK